MGVGGCGWAIGHHVSGIYNYYNWYKLMLGSCVCVCGCVRVCACVCA